MTQRRERPAKPGIWVWACDRMAYGTPCRRHSWEAGLRVWWTLEGYVISNRYDVHLTAPSGWAPDAAARAATDWEAFTGGNAVNASPRKPQAPVSGPLFTDADIGRILTYRTHSESSEISPGAFRGVVQEDHTGKPRLLRVKFTRGIQLVQADCCSWLEAGR